MRKFNNWENVKAAGDFVALPAGGYIAKIMDAKEVTFSGKNGDFSRLDVSLDIAEGEYQDYYKNDYKNQNTEDKKWRGVLKLYLPKEDGTEKDNWTISVFKAFTEAVEDSNQGYHWDWDETTLKGKLFGCLFRREEWEYNDKSGWKTQPYKATSVSTIKENKFEIPKDKPLQNKSTVQPTGSTQPETVQLLDDEDLPF